jgi:hypothetical protein
LEGRRERLQLELRFVEAELRSDEALRLQDREPAAYQRAIFYFLFFYLLIFFNKQFEGCNWWNGVL